MRTKLLVGLGVAAIACAAVAAPKIDFAPILAAADRPDADKARDADRKPAEVIAFAGVKAGDKIAELAPGGGYFTRLLSGAVGPKGIVYAIAIRPSDALKAAATAHPNVSILVSQPGTIPTPEPVDIVWTTLNYHDFKNVKVGEDRKSTRLNSSHLGIS